MYQIQFQNIIYIYIYLKIWLGLIENDVHMLYIEPLRPFQSYFNYKELSENILKYEKEILLHGMTVSALDVVGLTCSFEMNDSCSSTKATSNVPCPCIYCFYQQWREWDKGKELDVERERERSLIKAVSIWMIGSHQFDVLKF